MKYTNKQLDDWTKYERVRKEGKWNMFDKNAQIVSGLSSEEYLFCMKNYSELKKEINK